MENTNQPKRSLDECYQGYPELQDRLREIAGELELTLKQGGGLDEAEERVVPMLRKLGAEVLQSRARRMAAEVPAPGGGQVRRHGKKKSAG